jgi:hypothetical protein
LQNPCDSWFERMFNYKNCILRLRFMVVVIIWVSIASLIRKVDVIVVIIIIVPLLCFWNFCFTQSYDDISPQAFCHNSFSGTLSLDIQNTIINVWSFIVLFTYKNNNYLINWSLPSRVTHCVNKFRIGGWGQFMEVAIMVNLDSTSTLGFMGVGHHSYWPIGAWSKSKSCSIDSKGLTFQV